MTIVAPPKTPPGPCRGRTPDDSRTSPSGGPAQSAPRGSQRRRQDMNRIRRARAARAILLRQTADACRPAQAAFPWAVALPEDCLTGFLSELATAASGDGGLPTLATVEKVVAEWRADAAMPPAPRTQNGTSGAGR
jgi:hypothetical protein